MTPEVLRAFGAALRELREHRGYSQSDLGLDRNHVHHMEQGESDPKLTTLAQLARALRISLPTFAAEIDRRRDIEDPANQNEDRMLDDGILLMVRSGRLDTTKSQRWLQDLYTAAKARGAYKILLDLSGLICDFSSQEAYESAMEVWPVFRELNYQPTALAVVYNLTITTFGAKVAKDHGLNIFMTMSREEALAWLQSEPD